LAAMVVVVIRKGTKRRGQKVGIENHPSHTATTSSSPALTIAHSIHYILRF
jgi:hypothetical protein